MKQTMSPADIARQTLIQLAKRGSPPTPENYGIIYNEIAGIKDSYVSSVSQTLQKVLTDASKNNALNSPTEKAITTAIKKQDWTTLETQFRQLLAKNASNKSGDVNWSVLIRTLLKQLETSHKGITLSRKKDGLSRVLANFAKDPNVLAEKVQALIRSWGNDTSSVDVHSSNSPLNNNQETNTDSETANSGVVNTLVSHASSDDASASLLRDMMVRTLNLALMPFLDKTPEEHAKAQKLLDKLRNQTSEQALKECAHDLKGILLTTETERENQQNINNSIVDMLSLMANCMAELGGENEWLKGQIQIVNDVLSKPIDINVLQNAKSSLKELIHKQSNLKPAIHDAKELLKQMAETFVSRLVDITETTDDYQQRIENHQKKLSTISGIDELNSVLKNVLEDTRSIGLTVQRTREEFHESKAKIIEAEQKIQDLTAVLEYINEVANEDYLTGTLNRRGMEDALEREFSRADRHNTELSVAMMDIDHFKKLNDVLGHSTGDDALVHFTKIIKDVKRTTDVLARYGGEEFIIILPNTALSDAIKVVERVQRKLTKQFFMHSNERVVITFSAGVAQRLANETPRGIIPRADAALYEAKNAGRNRVVGAPQTNLDAVDPSVIVPPKNTIEAPRKLR